MSCLHFRDFRGTTLDSNAGNVVIHEDFFLKNSLIDSTWQYNDTHDTRSEKYFYKAANQAVRMNQYENATGELVNTTSYIYDGNGNLVKSADTDGNVDIYEYYNDQFYEMPPLQPYSSQKKMNLEKTHTVTSSGYKAGNSTSIYTFDSNNRISSITATEDDGTIGTKTFTYY